MKTVALIDHDGSGHHPTYVKLFAETLLSLGLEVLALCPNPQELRAWTAERCPDGADRLHAVEAEGVSRSTFPVRAVAQAQEGFSLWRSAARSVERASGATGRSVDLVFFPWLDSYLSHFQSRLLLDRVFPHPWSGLWFHPYHLRLVLKWPWLRRGPLDLNEGLRAEGCRAVGVLDEGVVRKLQDQLPGKAVIPFPDVTDEASPALEAPLARSVLEKARGRRVVSLLGSLEKRKGLLLLLEVARRAASRDLFFVFAGRLAEETFSTQEVAELRRLAAAPPDNCFFRFEFIPDEPTFNALVAVSGVLFAAYDGFLHSSNILTKAAVFDKPVVVSPGHCMAERVQAYGTGLAVDCGDAGQCLAAIERLCAPEGEPKPDYAGYRAVHSKERLRAAMKRVVESYG